MDEARGSKTFTNGAHSVSAAAPQPPQPPFRGTDFAAKSGKKETVSQERRLAFLIPLLAAIITENVVRVAFEQTILCLRHNRVEPPFLAI